MNENEQGWPSSRCASLYNRARCHRAKGHSGTHVHLSSGFIWEDNGSSTWLVGRLDSTARPWQDQPGTELRPLLSSWHLECLIDGAWTTDGIGDPDANQFETEAEAETALFLLAQQQSCPASEYRVVSPNAVVRVSIRRWRSVEIIGRRHEIS